METHVIYEIIGYTASVLIAVSLMMSAIIRLRIINLIGAATFCLYGILIGATPVAAMNGFIVLINIYYLSRMLGDKEYFQLLKVGSNGEYIKAFIRFYREEIRKFQPEFQDDLQEQDRCIFVLRNMVPAGLLVTRPGEAGLHTVVLDFVIPNYRDFKIGTFLFEDNRGYLKEQGIDRLVAHGSTPEHRNYLEKAGFVASSDGQDRYEWRA
ncbi:hypothetical protein QA596_00175 [Balneolales bacterium ANBcel1]|nr:hypothetical protein [Balneolales bacterium ANBcel1]